MIDEIRTARLRFKGGFAEAMCLGPCDSNRKAVAVQLMDVTFFKRFRMEADLTDPHAAWNLDEPLPAGYESMPWEPSLLSAHADTKFRSFQSELDANVFPSLGARDGCLNLMKQLVANDRFVAEATWLIGRYNGRGRTEYCGAIQAVWENHRRGFIQNLGVTPPHRGRRLGRHLLSLCLRGFREAGYRSVQLEVTARNESALRLYERLGFARVKTVYKAAEVACV